MIIITVLKSVMGDLFPKDLDHLPAPLIVKLNTQYFYIKMLMM